LILGVLMRKILTRLTLAPAVVLSAGTLALVAAAPAGATIITTTSTSISTTDQAGYQAGGTAGLWGMRYIQAEFTVPQQACSSDDFSSAGIQLAGRVDSVAVGVACNGSTPTAGYQYAYQGTTWNNTWKFTTRTLADDLIFASLYYDVSNNYVELYEIDLTTGTTLVNDTTTAYGAMYHWATASATVKTPLVFAPEPGTNFVLVPFTDVKVTSYNGTYGNNGGMNGPWGVTGLWAVDGAHLEFGAPMLYDSDGSSDNTFNTREYGNS
jgi:hypothetical protein